MEGIISTDENELSLLNDRLFQAINGIAPDGTTKFGDVGKHPTKSEWVLVIEKGGFYWEAVSNELTEDEQKRIKPITADWFGEEI